MKVVLAVSAVLAATGLSTVAQRVPVRLSEPLPGPTFVAKGKGRTLPRLRCGYAGKYQAKRAPICGCVACWQKWERRGDASR